MTQHIEIHLGSHFDFFAQMKLKLQEDAQVLIAYHWRKILKKKYLKKVKDHLRHKVK